MKSRKCSYTKPDGTPCNAWAMRESNPPLCSAHRKDKGPKVGAPSGNKNAEKHGGYAAIPPTGDLDEEIAVLQARRRQITEYIRTHLHELTPEELVRLATLEGQDSTRMGRLHRDKLITTGESGDAVEDDFDDVLDNLGRILSLDLTGE